MTRFSYIFVAPSYAPAPTYSCCTHDIPYHTQQARRASGVVWRGVSAQGGQRDTVDTSPATAHTCAVSAHSGATAWFSTMDNAF